MSFEQKFFRTAQHEIADEEQAAKSWRRVLLKLSNNFNAASIERADLSPVLMEALHHALENLLLLGDEADLMALEEWVDVEHAQNPQAQTAQELHEKRDEERRRDVERRFAERRIASHFQTPGDDNDSLPNLLRDRRQTSDRRDRNDRRSS